MGGRYVLALDQGTTSSRAMLFGEDGLPVTAAAQEYPQIYPQSGWVEHDPEAIWESQLATARQTLAEAKVPLDQIAAIGITNQRETTLLWDRATGKPVHHAIVWQDRRTAPLCAELRQEGMADYVRDHTGLVIDPYFSATKLHWLLEHVQGARERAERGELAFGTVDTFLMWRLSGGCLHVTDVSNASRTMLFDIHRLDWDETLLQRLRIPRAVLPEVRPSSAVYGETDPDLLGRAFPLAGAAGDQQAATFGQGCWTAGMAKNTYGTGCFLLLNTGERAAVSKSNLLTTVGWQRDGAVTYALEGSVFIGGSVVKWLRDGLGLIGSAAEVEALAARVPDSGGVVFVPAFVGLGAPYWDPHARGLIAGLTQESTAGHLARAAIEAICFQSLDVVRCMASDSGVALERLRVDGGAVVNDLLMQTQADLLGIPVERPRVTETTALGAAYLAGLAVGVWPNLDALAGQRQVDRLFEPKIGEDERESRYAAWRRAVERARG
ncbi:MAG TPA: glycerol kinase GlpK [Chloroflexota bacterium]|jgi:glycerol kinase